jgi:transcriptional regulator with XRE-family HTH domain
MQLNRKKINKEMERLGWSQAEYARQIKISRQLLNYWLKRPPHLEAIEAMAKPLHLDPKDLLI